MSVMSDRVFQMCLKIDQRMARHEGQTRLFEKPILSLIKT